eukprot:scaffold1223_cov136-Isochrysis_galbana.AAC.6
MSAKQGWFVRVWPCRRLADSIPAGHGCVLHSRVVDDIQVLVTGPAVECPPVHLDGFGDSLGANRVVVERVEGLGAVGCGHHVNHRVVPLQEGGGDAGGRRRVGRGWDGSCSAAGARLDTWSRSMTGVSCSSSSINSHIESSMYALPEHGADS